MVVRHYVQVSKIQEFKSEVILYTIKELVLTIYFYGPRAYIRLKTMLQPSPITLPKIIEQIQVLSGLSYTLFETTFTLQNNYCTTQNVKIKC